MNWTGHRSSQDTLFSGRQVVVSAGVEGTGHHLFHDSIFPALAKAFEEVYHDRGMEVQLKGEAQKVIGIASLQDHFSIRHGDDYLDFGAGARALFCEERLERIARLTPKARVLLMDTPSYPSCPLDLELEGCRTKSSWNNPDILAQSLGAARADPPWTLRTIVMVRSWPALLRSTLRRGIAPGGMPLELRMQANMLHTAMVILNSQVAALKSPWAVLEYDAMVRDPRKCARGLARFLGLPGDAVETVVAQVVRSPSSSSSDDAGWTQKELSWISETFESEEAVALWPAIEHGRKHRALC